MTDSSSLIRIVQGVKPDEIYNLAAQSHVKVSFEEPEYTANSDALGRCDCWKRLALLDWKSDALLPGIYIGTLRTGAGDSAERNDAVLSALSVCRCKTLCVLDHGELSRGLRNLCLQRNFV